MIRSSLQALLEGDAQLAEAVREMDDEIDRMNRVAQMELTKVIQDRPTVARQALQGIIVCRNLSASPTMPATSLPTSFSGSAAPTSATSWPPLKQNRAASQRTIRCRTVAFCGLANLPAGRPAAS